MSLRARREIERLKLCAHGGINYDEVRWAGVRAEDIVDFSVCTNPFMPPPAIKAIFEEPVNRYPDSQSSELRQRLGRKLGISPDLIVAGSGTTEIIRLVTLAYLRRRDKVLLLEPTFGEYEVACRIAGARALKMWLGLGFELDRVLDVIRKAAPRVVFLCNPNNPTGRYLAREAIEAIIAAAPDSLLVLDEAYARFVERPWASTDLVNTGNLVILRSMTKDYGLAGLRLGYAVARREISDNLRRVCPPWNVNVFAQKAGLVVLDCDEYLAWSQRQVHEIKRHLIASLTSMGFEVLPSEAHYFLVKVGDAAAFRGVLLKKGVLVRDCASFGLPEYVRIAPRTHPECDRLISEIAAAGLKPL